MYYPMYWGPEEYIKCCNKTKSRESGEWRRLQRESYKRNTSYAVNLKMLNTSIWNLVKLRVGGLNCLMRYDGEN